jgi:UDP-N-acetylmuramoylalanine--D-glutamate ligase
MSAPFEGEHVLVVGLGSSGSAAAETLAREGAQVRVSESRSLEGDPERDRLAALGVEVRDGGHDPSDLDDVTLVVTSPGVAEGSDVLGWATAAGLPIWSELELGARLCRVPYLAVTGTNGKSTTTELIAAMLRAQGYDAVACGNIGHPFTRAALEPHDVLVVEASSFQLRFHSTFHPRVSVLLNLAPDHIDWHGSMDAYAAAKARVFELQGEGDTHVGNVDDGTAAGISRRAVCSKVWFTIEAPSGPDVIGFDGGRMLGMVAAEAIALPAPEGNQGFRADAAAATAAALAFGAGPAAVAGALSSFRALPHRGEIVASRGSVEFVDDSKATNPHAALASLRGRRDCVLIAGGLSKGVDLSPLAEVASSLHAVVAIGEASAEIERVFGGLVPVTRARSLEEAVDSAYELAPSHGTVILAPACASQDMFRDYKERGERFAAAATRIPQR